MLIFKDLIVYNMDRPKRGLVLKFLMWKLPQTPVLLRLRQRFDESIALHEPHIDEYYTFGYWELNTIAEKARKDVVLLATDERKKNKPLWQQYKCERGDCIS